MHSMPLLGTTWMNERRMVPVRERIGEGLRALAGWLLALLMLVPALVITLADKLTMWRIRRRGGRD